MVLVPKALSLSLSFFLFLSLALALTLSLSPPPDPTKFFGCELGAQTQFDAKNDRFIVNGSHEANKLQDMLDGFIRKFVLCPECDNPETDLVTDPLPRVTRVRSSPVGPHCPLSWGSRGFSDVADVCL